ncbi:MAG: decaprenyl-phosphate phosphoribosyltransferase [Chloroflexi bacterium]|nr:MAG: decaprenyl-phosphate phosphoribosyltransferase [Chloroflexota bacterium]
MHDTTTYQTQAGLLPTLSALVRAMRPKQWPKNVFVFAALVFDVKLFDLALLSRTIIAAVLFCLISGVVYLINDLVDIEKDRQHPKKRHRPLASGQLSPTTAMVAAAVIIGGGLPLAFLLNTPFGVVLTGYLALQVAYSFVLKNLVIIDVLSVAAGFVLRAVGGAVAIGVTISPWLYVCTTLGALFIGFSRRRHELVLLEGEAASHRASLTEYSPYLLDHMIAVVASTTVIAYSLYTFLGEKVPANHAMMLTIPFVLYGIFRYLYLIHIQNEGGSPEELFLKDVPLLLNILLWGLTVIAILYFS